MAREQEVKYRVHDLEAVVVGLKRMGVELSAPVRQIDQAYAPVGWREGDDRIGVTFARLRTVGERHWFTTKRPVAGVLDCDERETEVIDRDQMHHAILAMGYRPTVTIAKTRRQAHRGPITVCLDSVDGAGDFLEVEYQSDSGLPPSEVQMRLLALVPAEIDAADRVTVGYDSLVKQRFDGARTGRV